MASLRRPKRPIVVLFGAPTHISIIRLLWWSSKRLLKHHCIFVLYFADISLHQSTRTFFVRLSNCARSNENKSFLRHKQIFSRCLCNIKCMLVQKYRRMIHDNLHYQFTYGINVLWHNGCFWRTFRLFVFKRATATMEFIKPVFHSAMEWCFISKQRIISSMLSCRDSPHRKL